MTVTIYTNGLDTLQGWDNIPVTKVYKFMLMKDSYSPDPDSHIVVDDIVSNEISATGYSRVIASAKVRTVGTGNLKYSCTDPNFGVINPGQDVGGMILYWDQLSGDSAAIIIAHFSIPSIDTGSVSPFIVNIDPTNGLITTHP